MHIHTHAQRESGREIDIDIGNDDATSPLDIKVISETDIFYTFIVTKKTETEIA